MITVVGVGALGSHVVQFLRSGGYAIKIVDYDRVEQKNVWSQFHARKFVGKSKVVALRQLMQFLYGVDLQAISHKLVPNNATQLLGGSDLVIDCLDNAEGRALIMQEFPGDSAVLHGALAPDGGFGRVVWNKDFVADSGADGATCENGEHLPFIAITAAYLARAAQEYLATGKKIGFQVSPTNVLSI